MEISPKDTKPITPIAVKKTPEQKQPAKTPAINPLNPVSQSPQAPLPMPKKPIPWLPIIIGVVVIGLIILGWMSFATININPSPGADTVKINGKQTSSTKIHRLPGKVTITIEKDGYLTYDRQVQVGFHASLDISPELKPLPVAEVINEDAAIDLTANTEFGGVKSVSSSANYLTWTKPQSGNDKSYQTSNINRDALDDIVSVQYPDNQSFALIKRKSEVGVLDFATPDTVSQDYTTFGTDIQSIALSNDGEEVFYWQYSPELGKNFLIRNNVANTKPDRYFDQPLLDQLDLTDPILHWSTDKNYVLAIEKNIILIDIVNRNAKIINYEKSIRDAYMTADNKTIVAITEDNTLLSIDLTSATESSDSGGDNPFITKVHEVSVSGNLMTAKDNSSVYLVNTDNEFVSYNFDEMAQIGYLLDESIPMSQVEAFAVDSKNSLVYFLAGNKIYMQSIVSDSYN